MDSPTTSLVRRKPNDAHHHGDLRNALLHAARALIAEGGVEALSLRECARRAGVSHAAPAHHFHGLAGLYIALAIDGFDLLAAEMDRHTAAGGSDPEKRLAGTGLGYIAFAQANPELFRVMFRTDLFGAGSPRLDEGCRAARERLNDRLSDALRARAVAIDDSFAARSTLAWCCVHGFSALWIDGPLRAEQEPSAADVLTALAPALSG